MGDFYLDWKHGDACVLSIAELPSHDVGLHLVWIDENSFQPYDLPSNRTPLTESDRCSSAKTTHEELFACHAWTLASIFMPSLAF
jgi:hypothetical protein